MQLTLHSKLSRVYETVECLSVCIGVNATGTLGGGRRSSAGRENRGVVGGEGVGSGKGLFPFPENL